MEAIAEGTNGSWKGDRNPRNSQEEEDGRICSKEKLVRVEIANRRETDGSGKGAESLTLAHMFLVLVDVVWIPLLSFRYSDIIPMLFVYKGTGVMSGFVFGYLIYDWLEEDYTFMCTLLSIDVVFSIVHSPRGL